jgi:microcystin degradation protein MlrC
MSIPASPRIALLGFSIECNKFAPVATKADFLARTYLEGDDILREARDPTPTMLPETPGFIASMDAAGPWTPIGIALAMTEPNGPVEHGFFVELLGTIRARLRAALPVDAVYICAHGAAVTTEDDDPEGTLLAMVREIVGDGVPIAATFDLHANVSDRMVQSIDAFIGYRTNPHLDMRERGDEAAAAIREMLAGVKTERALIRLPIVAPTVILLTAAGPYADMIELGQTRIGPEIMNVSVMGGFAYADTAKNGVAIIVTARRDDRRNSRAAEAVAREIAAFGWANRARFYPKLTALDDAVAKAVAVSRCRCCRQSRRRWTWQHDVPAARLVRGRGRGRAGRGHL